MEMEAVIRKKNEPLEKLLDEHTRRLWAATEANALGCDGISIISRATGISRRAILVGINENHLEVIWHQEVGKNLYWK
ncbi:hypothetical protein DESAMIL20_1744 [Desulfurella amilsii]|uniref:Uncharacterized protein n=1 Tax=Desulfurella amilsii TaxID=1562698 RepID=A0A1X4XXC4_9BACT|nr:hypothetical protein DESAMIL20_1744 [Desulfurella amilsii]